MEASIWSSPATRVIGRSKCRGTLFLGKDEFVFCHALSSDIIPFNILTVSITEGFAKVPRIPSIRKHNLLHIEDEESNVSSYFIVAAGTAEEINQHVYSMRAKRIKQNQKKLIVIQQEIDRLEAARQQAKNKRIAFRERLKKEKQEGFEGKSSEQQYEPQIKEADSTQLLTNTPILATKQLPPEKDTPFATALSPYDAKCFDAKRRAFVQDIIMCLEHRKLSLERMEKKLLANGIPAADAARIAVIILGVNLNRQPKLQLYNRLKKYYGKDQGSTYYYQTVGLLYSR